ncbi:MAG: TRZ/ATZ family hydrolase [Candidatus Nanopelagicales bacterium]
MRLDAEWVLPVDPAGVVLSQHSVVIDPPTIVAVLPRAQAEIDYPEATPIPLPGRVVMPGLVNTHTHAAMTLLRGFADDLPLLEWLEQRVWPTEARWVDEEFVTDGTRIAAHEMLRGGTTTFNDMYFYPDEAAAAAVAAGMRMMAGITYVAAPTRYATDEDESIARGVTAAEKWSGHDRVRFMLAPHSTYAASVASWEVAARRAEELGVGIHSHINETWGEVERQVAHHRRPTVGWLADHGALSPTFLAAHAVHMSGHELDIAAEHGVSVSHCPSSNLKLASGIAKVVQMQQRGLVVGIGTDGAASNNRLEMFAEMRLAALLGKAVARDGTAIDAHTALRMATLDGARALGWDDEIGSLSPGKQADVIAVDLSAATHAPVYDVASHLVYVAGRDDVTDVWVAGRPVVVDRRCVHIADGEVRSLAGEWRDRILAAD